MENNLPGGSNSPMLSFAKVKEGLSGIPKVLLAFLALAVASIFIFATYVFLSPNISFKDLLNRISKPSQEAGEKNGENNISEPYKSTPRPLAHGKQTYAISGSKKGAPKPSEVIIDPLDPSSNASQSATVKVLAVEGGPVTKVSIELITDNKTKIYPLDLSEGTNLDGVWKATWIMEGSYDYKYQMIVKTENPTEDWSVTLTFR